MLTLDVRPSKRLVLIYSLIYTLPMSVIIINAKVYSVLIAAIITISLLTALIVQLYALFHLKMLYLLSPGKIKFEYSRFSAMYDEVTIGHQGSQLIMLICKNNWQHRYVLCMRDSFSQDDFGALQRFLTHSEWVRARQLHVSKP